MMHGRDDPAVLLSAVFAGPELVPLAAAPGFGGIGFA